MDKTNILTAKITTKCPSSPESCSILLEKNAELERLHAELEQAKKQSASLASAYEKLEKKYRRTKSAAATYKHMLFGQSSEKSILEEEQKGHLVYLGPFSFSPCSLGSSGASN